jgi:hypothetical protein
MHTNMRPLHSHFTAPKPLEARIAPATLPPGGKVVTFTDVDNDIVPPDSSSTRAQP